MNESKDTETRTAQPEPPRRLGPLSLMEAAGAMGDLGTFLPLWLGMVMICGLDPGISLILAGAANVVTGLVFGIPMPVQPMKAIAAVSIALAFNQGEIAAAGLSVGLIVLTLALLGWFEKLQEWTPAAVVRGVQWAVALKLAMAGSRLLFAGPGELRPWTGAEGLWWAGLGLAVLVLLRRNRLLPGALVVLAIGLVGAAVVSLHTPPGQTVVGSLRWGLILPDLSEWTRGLTRGAMPQLPMTALNSVLAVCALAWSLFPRCSARITPRSVATSVGLMNLIAVPLGGMPMCHGSGGLAAQYGFGARSGTSVVLLGGVKIAVGLLYATSAVGLLGYFPRPLLGAWIIAAGIELVRHTLNVPKRDAAIAALVPGAVAASVPLVWAASAAWLVWILSCALRRNKYVSRYHLGGVRIWRRHPEAAGATSPRYIGRP